tara:strand:+ start:92 stop:1387 length:1296 start_codon:yes stop_codon:yes gene_type:complete
MNKFLFKNFVLIKFISCFVLSILTFFTFRSDLVYHFDFKILISFFLIQIIIWSIVFFKKNKKISIILFNLFFLVFLNLILTPIFHLNTFDVPARQPNYKITKTYKGDFFKGMFSGTHLISSDEKGYRTNKKINYKIKQKNDLRIFTIGASTTEQGETDNKKTWSNLLANKLEKLTDRNIEMINAGMAGLRMKHHFISFKKIRKYNPDVVIFLIGINDWNHHIINEKKNYLFPKYEISYRYKNSILFKVFSNINKQINKKLFNINKKNIKRTNLLSPEIDTEAYLSPQINSLEKRNIIKKFQPTNIFQEYDYWLSYTIDECKKNAIICLFMDQPTAYNRNISDKLKKRLWMTPPNQDYTLTLEDLIVTSAFYNNWLKHKAKQEKVNFYLLSEKIEPNTNYLIDDCHFSEKGSEKVSDLLANYISLNLKSILN